VDAIRAGRYHAVARCRDGTLVAWGYNARGQVGDGSTTDRAAPVRIDLSGVLAEETVTAFRAGDSHSLVLGSEGTLVAWGDNRQLGAGAGGSGPVTVDLSAVAGRSLAGRGGGRGHNLLRFEDGELSGWGANGQGQLGDGGTTDRPAPAAMVSLPLDPTSNWMFLADGSAALHSVAVAGVPARVEAGLDAWLARSGVGAEAGDLHDPDRDGIANIIEYAFGLDPMVPDSGALPRGKWIDGNYVIRFTPPPGLEDIEYRAEWSPTLEAGSWREVPDSGVAGSHEFRMPSSPRAFIRLKVERR